MEFVNASRSNVTVQGSLKEAKVDITQTLWLASGPIILIIGICGNVMILIVMSRQRMSGTSTSVHLLLMALADLSVLVVGMIPEWFENGFNSKFKEIHPITCKMEKFFFFTAADTSVWILVIFTLDRFVAICHPLRKKGICTPGRAKLFDGIAFLIAITKNLHVFFTRGAEYRPSRTSNLTYLYSNCGKPTLNYGYFESYIRPYIVFVMVNAIPFVLILFCNVLIIRALFKVKRMHIVTALVPSGIQNSDKSLLQMTAMCLSASIVFLVCVTPSIVLLIGKPYWDEPGFKYRSQYKTAKGINNLIMYVNHSVNVFLYCITGKRFRQVIINIICCRPAPGGRRYSDWGGDTTLCHNRGTIFSNRLTVNDALSGTLQGRNGYSGSRSLLWGRMGSISNDVSRRSSEDTLMIELKQRQSVLQVHEPNRANDIDDTE